MTIEKNPHMIITFMTDTQLYEAEQRIKLILDDYFGVKYDVSILGDEWRDKSSSRNESRQIT